MRPTLTIKNITFGKDIPKICLPIVDTNEKDILSTLDTYETQKGFDVIEIRIDFLEDNVNIKELFQHIRQHTNKLLLVTFRTSQEGGNKDITTQEYISLLKELTLCDIDMIDIEYSRGKDIIDIISLAHKYQKYIILSYHNFNKTPDNDYLTSICKGMEEYDGDILKMALMPENQDDVSRLLELTNTLSYQLSKPMITMSMSELGVLSRVTGEQYGSVMTFATFGKASAPGQIPLEDMIKELKQRHD